MKKRTPSRDYPRTARLNSLVREIVAEEIERIDDDRLQAVSVTSVAVDADMSRAAVYFDHGGNEESLVEIEAAFAELRPRLQSAVARQAKIKRTPELRFEADKVLRSALRIEDVLRGLQNVGSPAEATGEDAGE